MYNCLEATSPIMYIAVDNFLQQAYYKYRHTHMSILESEGLGSGVKELVSRDDSVTEQVSLRVQYINDSRGVVLGGHGEHVELVEFGDSLEELADVGAKSAVVDDGLTSQTKSVHVL